MKLRADLRYGTDGQAYITQVLNGPAVLKNLSAGGMCIQCNQFVIVAPGEKYTIDVLPEKNAQVERFSLDVESRWVCARINYCEMGFAIVVSPGTPAEAQLKRYLDFLAGHSRPVG
jgi:hypothetical protein